MINKMEKEKNNGQMVPVIMEDIKMVKKMDLEFLNGVMVVVMKEISVKMKFKVEENINGLMVEFMKVIGLTTKCMEKDITWSDGRKYEGEYNLDKKECQGIFKGQM